VSGTLTTSRKPPSSVSMIFPQNEPKAIDEKDVSVWDLAHLTLGGKFKIEDLALNSSTKKLLVRISGGRKALESLPFPDLDAMMKINTQERVRGEKIANFKWERFLIDRSDYHVLGRQLRLRLALLRPLERHSRGSSLRICAHSHGALLRQNVEEVHTLRSSMFSQKWRGHLGGVSQRPSGAHRRCRGDFERSISSA